MMDEVKKKVSDWSDDDEVRDYVDKLLAGEAYDHSGLVYGLGHAVYSLSDPRELILKRFVQKLSAEKGLEKEFMLYDAVERIAAEQISKKRRIYKGVSANVDFYSGLRTVCSAFLKSCLRRYSQLRVYPGGAHTAWRS